MWTRGCRRVLSENARSGRWRHSKRRPGMCLEVEHMQMRAGRETNYVLWSWTFLRQTWCHWSTAPPCLVLQHLYYSNCVHLHTNNLLTNNLTLQALQSSHSSQCADNPISCRDLRVFPYFCCLCGWFQTNSSDLLLFRLLLFLWFLQTR